ncbi:hypothetical protein IAT38_001741 [Cryptococcus sp. DSM 104549]
MGSPMPHHSSLMPPMRSSVAPSSRGSLDSVHFLEYREDYFLWRDTLYTHLLLCGNAGIVDGTDLEPEGTIPPVDAPPNSVQVSYYDRRGRLHEGRAGCVFPVEFVNGVGSAQRWAEWQRRESAAQGSVLATTSKDYHADLLRCATAREMWV